MTLEEIKGKITIKPYYEEEAGAKPQIKIIYKLKIMLDKLNVILYNQNSSKYNTCVDKFF